MKCHEIKELLPAYSNSDVSPEKAMEIGEHLKVCEDCLQEYNLIVKSWESLDVWPDIEPEEGYVSRFWTRLSAEQTWRERVMSGMKNLLAKRALVPAYAGTLVAVLVAFLYFQVPLSKNRPPEMIIEEDVDFVESLELTEQMDILQEMDWLEDLDVIEKLDAV